MRGMDGSVVLCCVVLGKEWRCYYNYSKTLCSLAGKRKILNIFLNIQLLLSKLKMEAITKADAHSPMAAELSFSGTPASKKTLLWKKV